MLAGAHPDYPGCAGDGGGHRGFATVLSAYAILTRELNDGYLAASQPASFTLWTNEVDEAVLR